MSGFFSGMISILPPVIHQDQRICVLLRPRTRCSRRDSEGEAEGGFAEANLGGTCSSKRFPNSVGAGRGDKQSKREVKFFNELFLLDLLFISPLNVY